MIKNLIVPVIVTNPKFPDKPFSSNISVRGIYDEQTKRYNFSVSEEFINDLIQNTKTKFCVLDTTKEITFNQID
jgi:hypothetical protein